MRKLCVKMLKFIGLICALQSKLVLVLVQEISWTICHDLAQTLLCDLI